MVKQFIYVRFALVEIALASISFVEIINEYMRLIAAISATATLLFVIIKFIRDEKERRKRSKLIDLQIENEYRKLHGTK